jgi:signal transduction histidine kinase/ActR/RegA family two-component response regulator
LRTAAYVWGEGEEIDTSLLPPMHITPEGGSNSQAILNKQTVVTNRYWDTMKNRPHVVLQENGIDPMSSLVVPMMVKNQVVGTLEVQAHEDGSFTPEHSIALEMAANLAAVAIDNVRLLETEALAREEAESANRMKDDFLSVLSHELRTPLNSILGWVRMLNKGGLTADQTSKALEVIERNTRIQSSLIEDLLDVSRIISNKMRIEKELTDLSTIAHTASEAIRPLAAAKNIEFRVETNREPLFTDGDPVRLQQLVSNLLQNAVKFTPVGGTIELTLERSDSEAVMRISDTGIGIENEMLPHIFERFRQGDASTKRGFTGLGLGLTIVRTIAELHGGDIAVESGGAGKGSTFTVRLPLAELFYASNGSRAKAAGDGPNGKTLSGIRILLVDDDADSLRPLQLFLQQHDADVSTAGSAESALDALGSKPFDVLITDIGMPVTDGFGLVTRMRDSAGLVNAGLPAIAVTAYASTEDRERAAAAGFQAHLAKPVDYDELLAAVNDLCRNDKAGAGL